MMPSFTFRVGMIGLTLALVSACNRNGVYATNGTSGDRAVATVDSGGSAGTSVPGSAATGGIADPKGVWKSLSPDLGGIRLTFVTQTDALGQINEVMVMIIGAGSFAQTARYLRDDTVTDGTHFVGNWYRINNSNLCQTNYSSTLVFSSAAATGATLHVKNSDGACDVANGAEQTFTLSKQ